MNDTGRKSWARVGANRAQEEAAESGLSGPVISYTLSREEIERRYGPVEKKEPHVFHKDWPHPGQANKRHIALRNVAE